MSPAMLARIIAPIAATFFAALAHAQTPADFYKSRTIDLYVGYSVGGCKRFCRDGSTSGNRRLPKLSQVDAHTQVW